jgi:transcriptional regulator with XRE-family HTH domain
MSRPARPLFPQTQRHAEALGERLRLARLRRGISLNDLAARVDATRITLARLERGDLSASLGLLARVLGVLSLDADLDQLARDDELGKRLQDIRLRRPRRTSARKQAK